MATYTGDGAQSYINPRYNEDGPTVAYSLYVANNVSISTGDVYQMVKVPNGAVIVDIKFHGRSSGTAGIVFNLGINAANSNGTAGTASTFGPVTISTTDQFIQVGAGASATLTLPWTVSISDDTTPSHAVMSLTVASGTITNTGTFGLIVTYLTRGQGRFV